MRALVLFGLAACGFETTGQSGPIDAPRPVDARLIDAALDGPPPLIDASTDASPPGSCLTSIAYTTIGTSRYRQLFGAGSWLAAEIACELDGSHLIVFDDAAEITATDNFIIGSIWIGVTDRVTEGTYRAVTNQPNPFTGAAANNNNTDCLRNEESDGSLADRNCNDIYAVVCECDGMPAVAGTY